MIDEEGLVLLPVIGTGMSRHDFSGAITVSDTEAATEDRRA